MEQENLDRYMVFIEDEAIEIRRAIRMMALQLALCGLAVWTVSAVIAVVVGGLSLRARGEGDQGCGGEEVLHGRLLAG